MDKKRNRKQRYKQALQAAAGMLAAGLLLAGCAQEPNSSQPAADPSDVCVISIENVTLMERNEEIEEIEKLANEITVPAIGCRVKIVDCPIPEHEDLMQKIRAGITQVDIVETGLTTSLSSLAASGMLLPLNELLDDYGRELKEKEGRLLHATTVDGKIYALSANLYCGRADGIGYNADLAEQYHIEMPENVDLEQLTAIGESLKEQGFPGYLTTQGNGSLTMFDSFYETELFSGDAAYGVILNPTENTHIVNLFATEAYRDYLKTIKNWEEKGLIPAASLLSGRNNQEMFNNQEVFFQFSSVSPQTILNTQHKGLTFEEKYIPVVRNRLTTRQAQEFAWGITKDCAYPDKAMELLNLIYTNGELSNLLQYGREEIDYEKVGEEMIRPLEPEPGKAKYSSYFSIFGDSGLMYRYETETDISMQDIRQFAAEAVETLTFGYVFRSDPVEGEVNAVKTVIERYMPILETGLADDVDELLDEFLTELDDAGIGRIIEENQKQLDAWLNDKKS